MSTEGPALGRSLILTIAYAAAHFGKSLVWYFVALLQAFFLTEVAGLQPAVMGVLLFGSLLTGAAFDVAAGFLWKRSLSQHQAAGALQFLGALLSATALLALLLTPFLGGGWRLPAIVATAVAFRVGYSLYDTPQNVLLSLISPDAVTRSRLAALRMGVGGSAFLLVAATILPAVATSFHSEPGEGSAHLFVFLGVTLATLAVISAAGLRLALSRLSSPQRAPPTHPSERIAEPPSPIPLPALFLMSFAFLLGMSAFTRLEPYVVVYALKSPLVGGSMAAAAALGMTVSQLLWFKLLAGADQRKAALSLSLILLAGAIAFALLALEPWPAVVLAFAIGAAGGGLSSLVWAAFAYEAMRRRSDRIGPLYGVFAAVLKLAPAAAVLCVGLILTRTDYRHSGSESLIWLMAGFPAIGAIGCVLILMASGTMARRRGDSAQPCP